MHTLADIAALVGGTLPPAESAALELLPEPGYESLGALAMAFLFLRAFSSGCAALTGVEAISNGVPAFAKPKSKNAATTLMTTATTTISAPPARWQPHMRAPGPSSGTSSAPSSTPQPSCPGRC